MGTHPEKGVICVPSYNSGKRVYVCLAPEIFPFSRGLTFANHLPAAGWLPLRPILHLPSLR
jgi:hypothetical protein